MDDINKKICPKNLLEHIPNMGGGAGGLRTYIENQQLIKTLKQIGNILAFLKYFLYISYARKILVIIISFIII